jgi:uncharacterized protein YndB with AHSA1/START domain
MSFDVPRLLGAMTRRVDDRERNGRPARAVVASRTYDTGIDDLWDALTNAERLPRWFLPITGELRPGGRFQLQGQAGGEILRCEPPRSLSVTWEYGGEVSWVDVRLAEDPAGGTRLELEHTAHVDPRWGEYGPGAVGIGWELALMGLDIHLGTGATVDPQQVAAWSASDAGKDFMRQSSDAWCRAAIDAGEDPAAATAAAARTTAAYTGGGGSGS